MTTAPEPGAKHQREMHARRRDAARRLPPLPDGRRDPAAAITTDAPDRPRAGHRHEGNHQMNTLTTDVNTLFPRDDTANIAVARDSTPRYTPTGAVFPTFNVIPAPAGGALVEVADPLHDTRIVAHLNRDDVAVLTDILSGLGL